MLTSTIRSAAVLLLAHIFFALTDDVCEGPDDSACHPEDFRLSRPDGVAVGHLKSIRLPEGREIDRTTLSLEPLLFELNDFMSPAECQQLIAIAQQMNLTPGQTDVHNPLQQFQIFDFDHNNAIDINEMRMMLESNFDIFFGEKEIRRMYADLRMDPNRDGVVSKAELDAADVRIGDWQDYLNGRAEAEPHLKARDSDHTWMYPDRSNEPLIAALTRRVAAVTQLPLAIVNRSDVQIVHYDLGGHYHAHLDSSKLTSSPCCSRHFATAAGCRPCRWLTLLVYLNDVEEGGETVFPGAHQKVFDITDERLQDHFNLHHHCHTHSLRVSPRRGSALLWFNHFVGPNGWLGEVDGHSFHGSCPVLRGHKWAANFWVKLSDQRHQDLSPTAN